jgi:hypothetical protein
MPPRTQREETRKGESVVLLGAGGYDRLYADGRNKLDGDAAFAVWQIFDAGDLADVLLIKRITGKVKGKRDEEAHALVKGFVFGEEVDAITGDIFGGGDLLEVSVARIGRAHFEGLADANTAVSPAFYLSAFLHVNIRTWNMIG